VLRIDGKHIDWYEFISWPGCLNSRAEIIDINLTMFLLNNSEKNQHLVTTAKYDL